MLAAQGFFSLVGNGMIYPIGLTTLQLFEKIINNKP